MTIKLLEEFLKSNLTDPRLQDDQLFKEAKIATLYNPWVLSHYAPAHSDLFLGVFAEKKIDARKALFVVQEPRLQTQHDPWALAHYAPAKSDLFLGVFNETISHISAEPFRNLVALQESSPQPSYHLQEPSSLPAPPKSYPMPQSISESQLFGQTVGCAKGYTTLEMFLASDYLALSVFPFIDIRGHYLENDTYAANLGLGGRYLPTKMPFIFGINSFYDYRSTRLNSFHQLGVGFEMMSQRWSFQANGYFPLGEQFHLIKCRFDYPNNFFEIRRRFESSFSGFNLSINCLVRQMGKFAIYASGGPYFLYGKIASSIQGFQVRVQPQYRDYVSLAFTVSHDPVFGTLFQGGIIFTLPLYRFSSLKNSKSTNGFSNRQIYQPVQRMDIIPLQQHKSCKKNF